ncbi:MAG TPA: OB-fold domain-containing protein [Burkholderiales bacterium]
MTYTKPLPLIDAQSRPYWEAARRHELRLPKCDACGALRIQFERWCPQCGSDKSSWARLSGRATVWSHCTFHRKYFAEFEADLPYGVALVQLEEGPKLITNIVGIRHDEVRIGLPVEVVFDDVTPEVTLIKFRPR